MHINSQYALQNYSATVTQLIQNGIVMMNLGPNVSLTIGQVIIASVREINIEEAETL